MCVLFSVVCCALTVVSWCLLVGVCRFAGSLCVVCCSLFVVGLRFSCLLWVVRRFVVVRCVLFGVRCLLLVVGCLVPVAGRLPFAV